MLRKRSKPRSFDEILSTLRSSQFDVREVPGVANQFRVEKHNCAALIRPAKEGGVEFIETPGYVLGGEIARLLDRGYQKFLKTSKLEITATAAHLKAIHDFSEQLKMVVGSDSFYNTALGTTSDRYLYDRVKGRDLPESKRPTPAWELPANSSH
jgi:hypothetical protein